MRLLVATSCTQGFRQDDVHFCVDGELVWIPPPCSDAQPHNEILCGCGRAFVGLASHRTTTTALVADPGISPEDYVTAVKASLDDQGWTRRLASDDAEALVGQSWSYLVRIAERYPLGTVLETHGARVHARTAT